MSSNNIKLLSACDKFIHQVILSMPIDAIFKNKIQIEWSFFKNILEQCPINDEKIAKYFNVNEMKSNQFKNSSTEESQKQVDINSSEKNSKQLTSLNNLEDNNNQKLSSNLIKEPRRLSLHYAQLSQRHYCSQHSELSEQIEDKNKMIYKSPSIEKNLNEEKLEKKRENYSKFLAMKEQEMKKAHSVEQLDQNPTKNYKSSPFKIKHQVNTPFQLLITKIEQNSSQLKKLQQDEINQVKNKFQVSALNLATIQRIYQF